MTTHEPYVADPAEPRPGARMASMRPAVVTLIVLLLAAQLTYLLWHGLADQDPALQAPMDEPAGPGD